jgi:hypothetical protein
MVRFSFLLLVTFVSALLARGSCALIETSGLRDVLPTRVREATFVRAVVVMHNVIDGGKLAVWYVVGHLTTRPRMPQPCGSDWGVPKSIPP